MAVISPIFHTNDSSNEYFSSNEIDLSSGQSDITTNTFRFPVGVTSTNSLNAWPPSYEEATRNDPPSYFEATSHTQTEDVNSHI